MAAEEYYRKEAPRGEFVLVIEGKSRREIFREEAQAWEAIRIEDRVAKYAAQGLDWKAAMKAAAKDRGISKRDVYAALLLAEENP